MQSHGATGCECTSSVVAPCRRPPRLNQFEPEPTLSATATSHPIPAIVMDVPLNRKDLESKGLDAKDTLEYIHDQIVLDVHKVQQRYSDLAEKLRRAADELDD